MKDVVWFPTSSLSEEYQKLGYEFAFMSVNYEQCHTFVKCRDFLQDAVLWQLEGKKNSIYNFVYNPAKQPPMDLEKMRMLVRIKCSGKKDVATKHEKMLRALGLIQHYEKMFKMDELTTIEKVKCDEHVWYFEGPKVWMDSPMGISMFSFLIRLADKEIEFKDNESLMGAYKKITTMDNPPNDVKYLKDCWDKMHVFLEYREKLTKVFDMFDKGGKLSTSDFHHRSGIQTLCAYRINKPADELNITFKDIVEDDHKNKPMEVYKNAK